MTRCMSCNGILAKHETVCYSCNEPVAGRSRSAKSPVPLFIVAVLIVVGLAAHLLITGRLL